MMFDIPVDTLGKQPALQIYTAVSSIYAVPSPVDRDRIIATLRTGLERLTASFPWIAGQVVDKDTVNKFGEFCIVPYQDIPPLTVVELTERDGFPSLKEMTEARFPARMLDEQLIASEWTLPALNPKRKADDPYPVFAVQASFIDGGLILTFATVHTVFDFVGQAHMQALLSRACRGEAFTDEEIKQGNRSRHDVVPFLDDSYDVKELASHMIKRPPPDTTAAPATPPPKASWVYFSFSPQSLAQLKAYATASLSSGFVSSDDVVTALLWQTVARARLHRLDAAQTVQLTRAADSRKSLGVSEFYPGFLQTQIYHDYHLEDLAEAHVGTVAQMLRQRVKLEDIGLSTRAVVTLINEWSDRSMISFTANIDYSSALSISSWAKPDLYGLDFGLGLGNPVAVRRPSLTAVEGLAYLTPKSAEEGMFVIICLRDEEIETLKADEVFMKYASFIG